MLVVTYILNANKALLTVVLLYYIIATVSCSVPDRMLTE